MHKSLTCFFAFPLLNIRELPGDLIRDLALDDLDVIGFKVFDHLLDQFVLNKCNDGRIDWRKAFFDSRCY